MEKTDAVSENQKLVKETMTNLFYNNNIQEN